MEKIKENKNLDLEKNIYTDILLKKRHTIKFANTHSSIERENLIKNAFYINVNYNKDFLNDKIIFSILLPSTLLFIKSSIFFKRIYIGSINL